MISSQSLGTIFALIAFVSWGLFPIYWKLLERIDPLEVTCHRAIWTFTTTLLITLITKKGRLLLSYLKNKRLLLSCFIMGTLLGFNWFLFVSAVHQAKVLEASFGYYINPMISVLIGIFYFREQVSVLEKIAIGIAIIAILYIGIGYGEMPWYAILLASSFALYGAIKKKQTSANLASLSIEFFFIMLWGLPYYIYLLWVGKNSFFQNDTPFSLLLVSTGLITIWPLYFFSKSTQLIKLSNIGFIQYFAPSISFLLGVFAFKESLDTSKLISFGMIWTALALYSYAQIKKQRRSKKKQRMLKSNGTAMLIAVCFIVSSCQEKRSEKNILDFDTLSIEILPLDLKNESIRALEIKGDKVFYAGLRSVGYFEISDTKDFSKVTKERLHPGDTMGYRSLAIIRDAYLFMSIGSPAKLYRRDMKNNTLKLVYRDDNPKAFYDSMKFWNDLEGICIGDPIEKNCTSILLTRNGGRSWEKVTCKKLPKVAEGEASFAASNSCIAIRGEQAWVITGGTKARVLHTPDKGETWSIYESPITQGKSTEGIFSIAFYDDNIGAIIGGDYKSPEKNIANKAITRDGGKTWKLISNGQAPDYRSCIQFIPQSKAQGLIAIGFRGIDLSLNCGMSWKNISQNNSFYTARFVSPQVLYAAGKGKIAKLTLKKTKK